MMAGSKLIVALTAMVFIAYGAGFVVVPEPLSQWVTGSTPLTPSALIDMRATYGGMSIAVGLFLIFMSRHDLRLGLMGVVVVMLCMALARASGILIDGAANPFMYVYLVLEVAVALVAGVLLKQFGKK